MPLELLQAMMDDDAELYWLEDGNHMEYNLQFED